MTTNRILAVLAAVLFLLSALTYRDSVQRAARFERGQKFLPHLNPDEIGEILIKKGEEATHLKRSGETFIVVEAGGYPAKNQAVNRLVRDVLDVSLEKKVGSGESLQEELELAPGGENTTEIAFKDNTGKEMVRFLIGKSIEGGNGNYVLRTDTDGEIYLTSKRIYPTSGDDAYLDKQILTFDQDEIAAIHASDFRADEQDGALTLADLPAGKSADSAKLNQLRSTLSSLRFDKHYLANDPAVGGLRFGPALVVDLDDQSGYEVTLAVQDEKHYMKVRAFHSVRELSIGQDDTEEQVREKSEILARGDEVQDFNSLNGSWIYEISETTAEKLGYRKQDLLE